MRKIVLFSCLAVAVTLAAQSPVSVGKGSYASFAPLAKSRTSERGGSQAYQMEHRPLYLTDELTSQLGAADGSRQGTLALPSNDWWTYALVNPWSGKVWAYPGWVEVKNGQVQIGYPTYWEPTGCEMKWDEPLTVAFEDFHVDHCDVAGWGDYHVVLTMTDGDKTVTVTSVHGCPITWIKAVNVTMTVTNPDAAKYYVANTTVNANVQVAAIGLLTDGVTAADIETYKTQIPTESKVSYSYNASAATLTTVFATDVPVLQGFLPHHYYDTQMDFAFTGATYATPRGQMRMAQGQQFAITYDVHTMLPFFVLPPEDLAGYSKTRMQALCEQYAQMGSFGADTYWGGKGLTQMMHYMTAALQLGDTAVYRQAKDRLKSVLIDWLTYTPGESQYFFAYYPKWGALVGFDTSYDSDTFNDHHFHYGYFVYAAAVLCLLDEEFKNDYGPMITEVARDYANWLPLNTEGHPNQPWFRTLDPYCGHSFAGGMGNEGNGNGQESSSEAMQSWGGLWMLGAALEDADMLAAGVFGYTLEARATAEYWFDRGRRNIDYTKYTHPYCCNLTMQGVGWWTWFSGDPVWMHSIQWLPISPVIQNYLSEDRTFAQWDYTEMYSHKEVGDYEAATGGLGDESGLGNVCLSYLAIFDPDSAAHVWDRADAAGKALARNADTGGITYLFAHGLRAYGPQNHAIKADMPMAAAYTKDSETTYAVFNPASSARTVHFSDGVSFTAAPNTLTVYRNGQTQVMGLIEDAAEPEPDPIAAAWSHAYPNIALHKPVTASSYENVGTMPVSLTDGQLNTRWGSQHNDGEYVVVDLLEQYYIHSLTLYWEAAYASRYTIEVSADSAEWQMITRSGSGGKEQVPVALRGRYLRLTGLERATAYGISLYELEAYGLPLNGDVHTVIAMEIVSDELSLYSGQTPTYEVKGYNFEGTEMAITPMVTSEVTETEYRVTATYNDLQAAYTWPILETVHAQAVTVTPDTVSVPIGDMVSFDVQAVDQFGYEIASYTQDYYAVRMVDTLLWFDSPLDGSADAAKAMVYTVGYADFNLALGKPATCSGTENENAMGADKAVDGQLNTRWGSRFMDDEWIEVDLLDEYQLDSIVLRWEAAYATHYQILLSSDGVYYTTAADITNGIGGKVTHLIDGAARYVRVLCLARSTGYGSSLYEIEIYGSGRTHPIEPPVPSNVEQIRNPNGAQKILRDGHLYILRDGKIYGVMGEMQNS